MDPRRLLTFRAVAHAGSFSRAAQVLNLSQPSVSQQISLLETETGVRLFDRGRGGTRLTAAGELLLGHADHVAWRLELAARQLAGLAEDRAEQLNVGAFPTALAGLVPEALIAVKAASPGLRIVLSEATLNTLEQRVLRGDLDLGVGYQDAAEPRLEFAGATRVDLMEETFLVAMPRGHPHAGGTTPIRLDSFADDDWVIPSKDGFIVLACRAAGFEPRALAVSPDPLAMTGLVTRGLAVGLVPSLLAHAYPGTTLRAVDGPVPRRHVFALTPPGAQHPKAHAAIAALRDAAQRLAEGLTSPSIDR